MTTNEVYSLARGLMDQYGLQNWQFKFNRRKAGYGLCRFRAKTIELSIYHATMNSYQDCVETIKHEISHALAFNKFGLTIRPHGYEWRSIARSIGCTGERCGNAPMPHRNHHTLYIGKCNHCNREFRRNRLREQVKLHARCPSCVSRIDNNRGVITWQRYHQNPDCSPIMPQVI